MLKVHKFVKRNQFLGITYFFTQVIINSFSITENPSLYELFVNQSICKIVRENV